MLKFSSIKRMAYNRNNRLKCFVSVAIFVTVNLYIAFVLIKMEQKTDNKESILLPTENPGSYLHSARFDLIFKMVFGYFYAYEKEVPLSIKNAYAEHLAVWNSFHEYCHIIKKSMFDSKKPCVEKNSLEDFITSYQNTIDGIRTHGFDSNLSQIPVDKNSFLLNGAHRLSAAVVLNKDVAIQRLNFPQHLEWGYQFFEDAGLCNSTTDTVILEWMRIQRRLSNLNAKVRIMTVFTSDEKERKNIREMIQANCSKDRRTLLERKINVTRRGAAQLLIHMFGIIENIESKVNEFFSGYYKTSSSYEVLFLFFYTRSTVDFAECQNIILSLYSNEKLHAKYHISHTDEENLILTQMILNKNSLEFMNNAVNVDVCKDIAKEIAYRSSLSTINPMPQIYLGRDDILIHPRTVLNIFGSGKQENVSILYRDEEFDKQVPGDKHGKSIQASKLNLDAIDGKLGDRDWTIKNMKNVTNTWDIFHDNKFVGYCYGLKFLSLEHIHFNWSQRHM